MLLRSHHGPACSDSTLNSLESNPRSGHKGMVAFADALKYNNSIEELRYVRGTQRPPPPRQYTL